MRPPMWSVMSSKRCLPLANQVSEKMRESGRIQGDLGHQQPLSITITLSRFRQLVQMVRMTHRYEARDLCHSSLSEHSANSSFPIITIVK